MKPRKECASAGRHRPALSLMATLVAQKLRQHEQDLLSPEPSFEAKWWEGLAHHIGLRRDVHDERPEWVHRPLFDRGPVLIHA